MAFSINAGHWDDVGSWKRPRWTQKPFTDCSQNLMAADGSIAEASLAMTDLVLLDYSNVSNTPVGFSG